MLAGYDQKSNVVLSDSKERVYSMDEGVEEVPLGLYLVKGDMMCVFPATYALSFHYRPSLSVFRHNTPLRDCFYPYLFFLSILIGEIDEERDHAIDLSTIRAEPIPPIRY